MLRLPVKWCGITSHIASVASDLLIRHESMMRNYKASSTQVPPMWQVNRFIVPFYQCNEDPLGT